MKLIGLDNVKVPQRYSRSLQSLDIQNLAERLNSHGNETSCWEDNVIAKLMAFQPRHILGFEHVSPGGGDTITPEHLKS